MTRLYPDLEPTYAVGQSRQSCNGLELDTKPAQQAFLAGLTTMCFVFGQMGGTFLAKWIPPKPILIVSISVSTPLLAAVAANPLDRQMTVALLTCGILSLGFAEGIAISLTTFPLRSQEEIGTAGGLCGTIRAFGSALGTVVYSTILNNRLSTTIPAQVVPVLEQAALSASSIPIVVKALEAGTPLTLQTVPGLNAQLLDTVQAAYRVGCAEAYRTVFLSTLGFSGVAMILVWFSKGVDQSKANYVARELHRTQDEKTLEAE